MADIVGPLRPSDSWSTTEVKSIQHSHVWTIRGFSQCECRYLETAVKVKDQSVTPCSTSLPDTGHLSFRIRLHPQGNKESNKDFSFFQVFCSSTNQSRYKAKFAVFNSRNEEIPTTVYTGTQQLHGYFEYIRRDLLVSHIAPQDEVQLVLNLTVTFDTVTRNSQSVPPRLPAVPDSRPLEVTKDLETVFRDRKLTDFTILIGDKDKKLEVHKVVLAARSPYFSALLEPHTEEFKNNQLVLRENDVEYEVMQELLHYMYTGRSPRLGDMALDLLAAADRFAMPGLKEMAEQNLRSQLNTECVCRTLIFADMHSALELKQDAIKYIAAHSQSVLTTDGWQEMVSSKGELVTEVVHAISSENRGGHPVHNVLQTTSSSSTSTEPAVKRFRFNNDDDPLQWDR